MSDPHQPGTPAGTDPADRDTLVAKAEEAGAPDGVLGQLRRLPADQRFENVQEVAQALGLGTEQERF